MASRNFTGGGFGNDQPPINSWNAQENQEFGGMWNPASVDSDVLRQVGQNDTSGWQAVPDSRASYNQLYQAQGDMNLNWRADPSTVPYASPQSQHAMSQYPLPVSTSAAPERPHHQMGGLNPTLRNSPNTYEQSNASESTDIQDIGYWRPPQGYESDQSGANDPRVYYNSYPQHNDWRSMTGNDSSAVSNQNNFAHSNPANFKNPLMDSDADAVTDTESLIKNMHIEGRKAQIQMQNKTMAPSMISKASLAMLKQDLDEAAECFESAEALRKARERELGLSGLDEVGTIVVVSNLSANAANFVPRSKSVAAHLQVKQRASDEEEVSVISSLESLIETVLPQPGSFDNMSAVFLNQVCTYTHSDETVQKMVDMIFNKAIIEDKFQYHGARLCEMLTHVLSNFRTIFLKHFQKEFETVKTLIDTKIEESSDQIHTFLSFMAEVFIHIMINGKPIITLGKAFARSLDKLVSSFATKNVKFVCKMLKLTGAKLRDALEKDSMEIYEAVFKTLKTFADKQSDPNNEEIEKLLPLVTFVSQLKDKNWGRTYSNTRKKSSIGDPEEYGDELSETDQNYYMNEPVFFTPDGVQYTAAEAQIPEFYDMHLAKFNLKSEAVSENATSFPWNPTDDYFDDFVPSDEEAELYKENSADFDDEFEKFLMESGQLP